MLILTASLGRYIAAVALYQSQEKPALTTLAERLGAANLKRLKILGLVLLTAPLVLCWNALGSSRAISVWPDIVSVGGLVSLIWAPPRSTFHLQIGSKLSRTSPLDRQRCRHALW